MVRHVVIVEQGENGFGAYVPDIPGCVDVGETKDEALRLIQQAIGLHLESLRDEGLTPPEPSSSSEYVEVGVA